MRRTVVTCASLIALLAPAAALAMREAPGDGTLVVTDGSAPKGAAVVTLVIRGAVIGHVTQGSVVIEDLTPTDGFGPEVTGFGWHKDVGDAGVAQKWGGVDVRFRAVGGSYRITVFGTGVDLVASGHGNATLLGSPDLPNRDGTFSLNGADSKSLPAIPTKLLTVGLPIAATG